MPFAAPILRRSVACLIAASVVVGLALAIFVNNGRSAPAGPWQATWETGHILLFFCVVWGMGIWFGGRTRPTPVIQVALVLGVTLLGGGLLELVQGAMGRPGSPSLADMRRNLAGALAGLAFAYPLPWLAPGRKRLLRLLTVMVLATELWPALSSWRDELAARRAFPILADFEQASQARRWTNGGVVAWPGRGGVLQVPLVPNRYSGTQMVMSARDWSGYATLRLSLYNPTGEPQRLWLSLRDHLSQRNGAPVSDRFTTAIGLTPGWNELRVDLDTVRRGPADRMLDLEELRQFDLFFERPALPFFLLDDVRLVRDTQGDG